MIWVINSNSNTCRIYHYDKQHSSLSLLKEIQHPENKLKTSEMVSDRPGRYASGHAAHGSYVQASDPKEVAIDRFCREIAHDLAHERSKNSYDKLIMIAAPTINGSLLHHMDKHVKNLVTHNIQKDLLHLPDHELLNVIRENTKFPGK